jgi:hypothetical protein
VSQIALEIAIQIFPSFLLREPGHLYWRWTFAATWSVSEVNFQVGELLNCSSAGGLPDSDRQKFW